MKNGLGRNHSSNTIMILQGSPAFFSVAAYSDAEKDVHLKNYSLLGISNKDVELNYNMNYTDQKKNSPRKRALKLLRKADQKNL